MSIINVTYFQKANGLNIPLAAEFITANPALETPNSNDELTSLCEKVEKSLLINALGLATYNELQLAIADDFVNPLYAKYEKLVKGEQYDGKLWNGLEYEYSFIAWAIYQKFLFNTNDYLTGIGTVNVTPEKANLVTPAYKIAGANANFIQGYQGGYMKYPMIYNDGYFIDYYGCSEDIEVSLYRYLTDHSTDFSIDNFRTYESINSFGV